MELGPTLLLITIVLFQSVRKGSLSKSGLIGASLVGLATFSNPQVLTTVVLLVFFVSSSMLTKFHFDRKQTLEEGLTKAGQRGFIQVMCNGLTGSVMAVLYQYNLSSNPSYANLCLTSGDWTTFFLLCFIGHYACCCADTWASEVGILNPDWPYLITTLKQVPPGTNGAISLLGTLASLMGGQTIGLVSALTLRYQHPECGLRLGLMGLGIIAGLTGSLIDSLLGATVQATYLNKTTNKIIHGTPAPSTTIEKSKDLKPKCISGKDYIDNNMVNFLSSLITALFTGILGTWLLYAD